MPLGRNATQLPLSQSPVVWAVRGLQLAPVVVQVSWASTYVANALAPAGFAGCAALLVPAVCGLRARGIAWLVELCGSPVGYMGCAGLLFSG